MARLLTEFLGTFFLMLVIALTGDPLAIGLALVALVYMGGHISGAHYNPAATLGIRLTGGIDTTRALQYVLVQVVAACVAVYVAAILGVSFVPLVSTEVSMGAAFLAEFLFTFALVLVILNVAFTASTKGNDYYGLAIGVTVLAGAAAVGDISGAVFNPAVGLGPWLIDLFQGGGFTHVWLYIVAPLVGAGAAAWVFGKMYSDH